MAMMGRSGLAAPGVRPELADIQSVQVRFALADAALQNLRGSLFWRPLDAVDGTESALSADKPHNGINIEF